MIRTWNKCPYENWLKRVGLFYWNLRIIEKEEEGRKMKKYSFDEQAEIDNLLETGKFTTASFNMRDLYLLAKHYRINVGYGATRIYNELLKFTLSNDPYFNEVVNGDFIKRMVRAGMKSTKIKKILPISFTRNEIETIQTVKNYRYQKLLFTLLLYAKAARQNSDSTAQDYYVNCCYLKSAANTAKVKISEKNILFMFYEIKDLGLTTLVVNHKFNSSSIKFLFTNTSIQNDLVIIVDDFDNPIEKFIEYTGGHELVYCEDCGKVLNKKSNRHKLCDECRHNRDKERNRLNMQRARASKNELVYV
jgi:hypothetical protein